MNLLFYKITVFLLIAACAILCIDRARQNLYMDKVAYRIFVEKKALEQKCTENIKKAENLQNIVREREQRFHFVLYSEGLSRESGMFALQNVKDLQMAKELAFSPEIKTPQDIIRSARMVLQQEDALSSDDFAIDRETGLVFSRWTAILGYIAKFKGMDIRTTPFWDLQTYTAGTAIKISEPVPAKPGKKIQSVVLEFSGGKIFSEPYPRKSICQRGTESVVFPFCLSGALSGEKVILPRQTAFPIGGPYLHYFHASNTGPWFLAYAFPNGTDSRDVNLQVIPLLPDIEVTTQTTGTVQSFLIKPGHSGLSSLLIVGDKTFFPVMVTASPANP